MYANYVCKECNKVIEFKKQYGIDFPEMIMKICESSEHDAEVVCTFLRDFGNSNLTVDVAEGKAGNSKTGYETNMFGYAPGRFAPKKPNHNSIYNDRGQT